MAFAQELKDFTSAFTTGYDMVKSPEEKEQEAARTRHMNTQADAAEYNLSDAQATEGMRHQALDLGNQATQATIDNTGSLMEQRQFQMDQERENAPLKRQALELDMEASEASTASTRADTDAQEMENEAARERKARLKSIMERKGGMFESAPSETPADKPGAVDIGPTSSLSGGEGGNLTGGPREDTLIQSAHEAAKVGLQYTVGAFGLGGQEGVDAGGNEEAQLAFLSGDGAEDPKNMEVAREQVKEAAGREMSPAEENLVFLASMHELHLAEGEPEKAQKVAGAIMQSYRMKAGQYAAVAQAAAEDGDIDNTIMALAKSYSFVPDGYEVSFSKDEDGMIVEERKNIETGKVTESQVQHPREVFAQAMEVHPAMFDQVIMGAAGERAAEVEPIKPSDHEKIFEQADRAIGDLMVGIMPEGAEEPPELPRIRSATEGILQGNLSQGKHVSADDAARAAWEMTVVDPEAPDSPNFGVKEVDGGRMVNFPDGTSMFVPQQQFRQLQEIRGRNAQQAGQEAQSGQANADRRNARNQSLVEGVGQAIDLGVQGFEDAATGKYEQGPTPLDYARDRKGEGDRINADPEYQRLTQQREQLSSTNPTDPRLIDLEKAIMERKRQIQAGQ